VVSRRARCGVEKSTPVVWLKWGKMIRVTAPGPDSLGIALRNLQDLVVKLACKLVPVVAIHVGGTDGKWLIDSFPALWDLAAVVVRPLSQTGW